jgi:hypothetical protein
MKRRFKAFVIAVMSLFCEVNITKRGRARFALKANKFLVFLLSPFYDVRTNAQGMMRFELKRHNRETGTQS